MSRSAATKRVTKETQISARVDLDGTGVHNVATMVPFFDHMLGQLAKHGSCDIELQATGDIEVDAHHLIEDVGIVLGQLFAQALGDKVGITRFASVSVPLDEALVDVALDLSGRAYLYYAVDTTNMAPLGSPAMDPQLGEEFFRAFCHSANICLHIDLRRGVNAHHILEATFKAVARAIASAKVIVGDSVPSTKGVL